MTAQLAKIYDQFCLTTFSFNYFEVRLALSFRFFLVEGICYLWYSNWCKNETSLPLEADSEAYSEPSQTSKIEVFAQIVNDF